MIAPILERKDEVVVTRCRDGTAYLVQPADLSARVDRIVDAALGSGATILVMPEMVLSKDALATLRTAIRLRVADYAEANRSLPPLRWTFAGVVEPQGDGVRNYVVVLDAEGEPVAEQDKFSRWNLTEDEQRQYALVPDGETPPAMLYEAIEPASHACILELPGLGRVVVLICADMDVPQPGDWLFANSGLDWTYAPIMDRTRVPNRRRGSVGPWIVKRAHRAACMSQARVIVTNSMALTFMVNETNSARRLTYPEATECHVALLLDGAEEDVVHHSVIVPMAAQDVAEARTWGDGWVAFLAPESATEAAP
jgi:predicted amidohydrolase